MSGFIGKIGGANVISFRSDLTGQLVNRYEDQIFCVESRWGNKFVNDKAFYDSDRFAVITDGVIFNLKALLQEYGCDSLGELCVSLYEKNGESFFNILRGSFAGLFWNKSERKLIIFTDQIGDYPIFFSNNKNTFVFGSELGVLVDYFKTNNMPFTLNEFAAMQMITFGFLIEDATYVNEITKLCAGQYLVWIPSGFEVKEYHRFTYNPDYTRSESSFIEDADRLFKQAVERQISKNNEYGYKNVAPISAGMDTRMVNYYIRKLTDEPVLNFTYSQSGFIDETMAREIAGELKNRWLFKAGDHGYSLYNIDSSIQINGGLMSYYGAAVVDDIFSTLNPQSLGLIHTGLRGSGTISTYNPGKLSPENIMTDAFSCKMNQKMQSLLDVNALQDKYRSLELFTLYNCGFGGLNMGSPMVFRHVTESYSPFLDVDFLEFSLTIPFEMRYENGIYDKWMLAKCPEAAKYMHNGIRYIGGEKRHKQKPVIHLGKRYYSLYELPRLAAVTFMRRMGWMERVKSDHGIESSYNVAPIGYWYNTNASLKAFLDNYFHENIVRLDAHQELQKYVIELYMTGNGMEKNQALTLLGVMKAYFG